MPKGKNASQIQDDELPQWLKGCEKAKETWEFLKSINVSEDHEMLALLRDNEGKPFIPGSSLKGAFRTVAEALSNSCLSQLEFEWELKERPNDIEVKISKVKRYYSYRKVRSPQGVGIVSKLPKTGEDGKIKVMEKAHVFFRKPHGMKNQPKVFDLSQYYDAQEIRASVAPYEYWRKALPPFKAVQELGAGEVCGILKITEITEVKKSQRLIYFSKPSRFVWFSEAVRLAYNRAIRDSIEDAVGHLPCEVLEAGNRSPRHELKEGDIVYFNEAKNQVTDMGPVELYRVLYNHSLDEILLRGHEDFLPCNEPEKLCPCCRIFGWLAPYVKEGEEAMARKGFVHFSTAKWVGGEPKTQWASLQPLGQPHPSCWQFYLNCKNVGENAGYNDQNATIRGRKFYWHKPKVNAEKPQSRADVNSIWDQREGNGQPVADSQNKTVELLIPENANFEFTVDFENLSDAELGLLLLTLQPNLLGEQILKEANFSSELYHHFGMVKPLGLGSAKVEIRSINLYDSHRRYQDLMAEGLQTCMQGTEQFQSVTQKYILAFVREALDEQGKPKHDKDANETLKEFLKMLHINALFIMLDWKKAENLPVQYPPGHTKPNHNEYWEAFRWFTHQNQRDFLKTPRHILKKPEEIAIGEWQEGFPPSRLPSAR
ncbi:MAG: TIGR03986 family CRISPR-associated RAMP protein [Armatimonadetes bacterium]|nr:TIGR03986 family CRISPR-associated RAMP protein [Armatimonadota bacterium]